MKPFLVHSLIVVFALLNTPSFAAVVFTAPAGVNQDDVGVTHNTGLSIENFLNMTPKAFEEHSGKKMSWTKKLAFKMVQKKVKKKAAKGELDLAASYTPGKMSLLSLIFGSLGMITIFLPVVGFFLSVGFSVAGLVLGIVAIKREGSNVMNILGIVFSATTLVVVLLIYILILLIFASLF